MLQMHESGAASTSAHECVRDGETKPPCGIPLIPLQESWRRLEAGPPGCSREEPQIYGLYPSLPYPTYPRNKTVSCVCVFVVWPSLGDQLKEREKIDALVLEHCAPYREDMIVAAGLPPVNLPWNSGLP
ncbi:Neprilysin-2 [Frankliniella fusca]|uniref:Neprilysin-2 n=1 Tax=Frankliniella fusca TaxID=407009 RepID=A0AAE1LQX6_9NEOP|nr:Neprilysin-2 [Frankliniella fusca]